MKTLRPDTSQGCIIFFIGYAATFLVQLLLSVVNLSDNAFMWTYAFCSQLIFITAAIIGNVYFKVDFVKSWGLKNLLSPAQIGVIILAVITALAAFAPLASITSEILMALGYDYLPAYADYTSSAGAFALGVAGLCLMPAFGEELLIRGTLTRGLLGKGYAFSIFISALIFALIHGNAVQLVHQFCIGALMAYLVLVTGSVWASVIFHFCNNLAAILLDLIIAKSPPAAAAYYGFAAMDTGARIGILLGISLVGIILLFFVVLLYNRISVKKLCKKQGLTCPARPKGLAAMVKSLKSTLLLTVQPTDDGLTVGDEAHKGWGLSLGITFGFVVVVWILNVVATWIS